MTAQVLLSKESVIQLKGELKFPSIVKTRQQVEALLKDGSNEILIDFSEVLSSDSSALSLWLCCQRTAEKSGRSVKAVNVPQELQQFASVVGLEEQLCSQ